MAARLGTSARCGDLFISTGDPGGLMAMATRPSGNGKIEIESADDFILTQRSAITNVTFTGLLTGGATAADIKPGRRGNLEPSLILRRGSSF